ncbi:MAG: hypothetical protein WCL37_00750 [Chrysiogenales bacterium]
MKFTNHIFLRDPGIVICLCLLSFILPAETLTYREVEGDITVVHTVIITPAPPGWNIELESRRGVIGAVRQTFRTAADFSTLAWTFSDPGRQMELDARLQGEAIILSGTFRGNKVEKKFAAAGAPWNQLFQMGLAPFALTQEESFQFRSIGTQGPGELKIGKFTVARKDDEMIKLEGKEITAFHLRISLSGLLSIFWHGDYWFRKSDGRFLRYRGKNRSGGPVAVSELVAEK